MWGEAGPVEPPPSDEVAFLRLLLAAVLGVLIAGIARLARRQVREDRDLTPTLVVLPTLVALVSLIIGGSLARAFSLVGALAVVRFRTAVEDTRDTAFVIYAVGAGMAAGVGLWHYPMLAAPIVAAATWATRARRRPVVAGERFELRVRVAVGVRPDDAIGPLLDAHATTRTLISAATVRQGAALDVSYAVELIDPAKLADLIADLNRVSGVQEAEAKKSRD